jgi:hypothetical protein
MQMDGREEQDIKASDEMVLTWEGHSKRTSDRPRHDLKQALPSFSTDLGMEMDSSEWQPSKQLSPIRSTEPGMQIDLSDGQSAKARRLMVVNADVESNSTV